MIISASALAWLVSGAIAITLLAPILLIILWINDKRKRQLW